MPAFDLSVKQGQCLLIDADHEPTRILQKLFLRELKPTRGWIEEVQFVPSISNTQIHQHLNFEKTIRGNLQSLLFQERIWFENRFCSQDLLMEYLQLTPMIQKQKLNTLSNKFLNRFLALALVLSKVHLALLDSTLAPYLDSLTTDFLKKCFPSPFKALVVFAPTSLDQTMFDAVLEF